MLPVQGQRGTGGISMYVYVYMMGGDPVLIHSNFRDKLWPRELCKMVEMVEMSQCPFLPFLCSELSFEH